LHKNAKDWEDTVSPNTLKAGTLLGLMKLRFPGETQGKLYWFPFILTSNFTSDNNKIYLPDSFKQYSSMFTGACKFTKFYLIANEYRIAYANVVSNGTINTSGAYLEVNFDTSQGITPTWANGSILTYWGLDGPSGSANPFEFLAALSVLPGDTLVPGNTHIQLHHYPYDGVVKGSMLYPQYTIGTDTVRNHVLKRVLKNAASVGLTGLLVDEATYE
jgi:hypothetical protein